MPTNDLTHRQSIATEHATDRPAHIGRDATGADHFWSIYDRTVIVVETDAVATCDLSGTNRPLKLWRDYTESERGWAHHTIIDTPLLPVA